LDKFDSNSTIFCVTSICFICFFLSIKLTLYGIRDKKQYEFLLKYLLQDVDYREEEEYEYKMAREYNWNVKSKQSKGYEENFFFLFR